VLEDSESALVSIVGGPDMAMADVERLMGKLNERWDGAHVVFGAAIDPAYQGRMAATLIVSGALEEYSAPTAPAAATGLLESRGRVAERSASELLDPQLPAVRQTNQFVAPPPALTSERREQLAGRSGGRSSRKKVSRMQKELPLDVIARGRFEKSEPTIRHGEDLDVPTYIRRRLVLN
jgi:cell division protein FtsZ